MFGALKNGGYIYGECNFVFPYHGYPHHYFNSTQQGIEQLFTQFRRLRASVAPYQMPSFGIRFVLETYRRQLAQSGDTEAQQLSQLVQNVLDQPLGAYDQYFPEEAALRLAAGVFFFGVKLPDGASDVIPSAVQDAWHARPDLQQRFPDLYNIGTVENVMLWAKDQGRRESEQIAASFDGQSAFDKGSTPPEDAEAFMALPVIEPRFGHISDSRRAPLLTAELVRKNAHITNLENLIQRIQMGRVMRLLGLLKRS
jgi:hypothetical protein